MAVVYSFLLLLIFSISISHIHSAAVTTEKVLYDVHGNYLPPKRNQRHAQDASNCCILPTCDEHRRCYETLSCGYICSQGLYRPVGYDLTPGYRLKKYYFKEECHFGECRRYEFLCTHCPDPNLPYFSYHTVRSDCKNCYY